MADNRNNDPNAGLLESLGVEPPAEIGTEFQAGKRRRPIPPTLQTTQLPPRTPPPTNSAPDLLGLRQQRRMRPLPPLLGGYSPLGLPQTAGNRITQKKLRIAQVLRERPGQYTYTPEKVTVTPGSDEVIVQDYPSGTGAANLTPPSLSIRKGEPTITVEPESLTQIQAGPRQSPTLADRLRMAYSEVPLFGSFQRGLEAGVEDVVSTLGAGTFNLLGNVATRIQPYFSSNDYRSGFYEIADAINKDVARTRAERESAISPKLSDLSLGREMPSEEIAGVVGATAPQVAQIAALSVFTGGSATAAFGLQKLLQASARGVTDTDELVREALLGTAEGAVFARINALPLGPTRLVAQTAVGVAQPIVESKISGKAVSPEDVVSSALSNLAFDLIGPFEQARAAESPSALAQAFSTLEFGPEKRQAMQQRVQVEAEKLFNELPSIPFDTPLDQTIQPGPDNNFGFGDSLVQTPFISPQQRALNQIGIFDPVAFREFTRQQRESRPSTIDPETGQRAFTGRKVRDYPLDFDDYQDLAALVEKETGEFPINGNDLAAKINRLLRNQVQLLDLAKMSGLPAPQVYPVEVLTRMQQYLTSVPENSVPAPATDQARFYPGGGGRQGTLYITPEVANYIIGDNTALGVAYPTSFIAERLYELKRAAEDPDFYLVPTPKFSPEALRSIEFALEEAKKIGSNRIPLAILGEGINPQNVRDISRHESIHAGQPLRAKESPFESDNETNSYLPEVMDRVGYRYGILYRESNLPIEKRDPRTDPRLAQIVGNIVGSKTRADGYPFMSIDRFLATEAPAYIGGGEYARFGLSSADAGYFMADYLENIFNEGGFEALTRFAEIARLSPKAQPLLEAVMLNAIAKGKEDARAAGLGNQPLYGGLGGIFDPEFWKKLFSSRAVKSGEEPGSIVKADPQKLDPTGRTQTDQSRTELRLPDLERRAEETLGRPVILTQGSKAAAERELSSLREQMLTMPVQDEAFERVQDRYVALSSALADADNVENISDYNSLYGHVWKIAAGNIEGARELWNAMGLGREMVTPDPNAPENSVPNQGGGTTLSANPIFDPENYRRLFQFFTGKQESDANSQRVYDQGAAELSSRKTPDQQTAQTIIEASTAQYDAQLKTASIEYERAKRDRKAARDRLKSLEMIAGLPQFLDPAKKAKLDAEIAAAREAVKATAGPASQAFQRFKGARESRADFLQEQLRLKAQERAANPDAAIYRVDPDTPYMEEIQNINVIRPFLRFAKDTLNAQGVYLDPNQLVSDQIVVLGLQGKLPPLPQLIPILEKNGISFEQYLTDLRGAASRAGSILEPLSKMRRAAEYLAQQKLLPPQYAKVLALQLPKLKDITPYLRERSYLQRLVGLNQGIITSMFRTAMNNFLTAGIRVGMDSLGQLFDSAAQNLGGQYVGIGGRNKNRLSPVLALRPFLMMLSEAAAQPVTGARKKLVGALGGDPTQVRDTRANRFFAAIESAYPKETFPVGEIALNADLQNGEARILLLEQYLKQAQQYPGDTKQKAKVIAQVNRALEVARRDNRLIARAFTGAESLVSVLTWANLAQERIARRAIFEAKLRRYATEAGLDVDGMISDGTLANLPVELVTRAGDEALRLTYGKRRFKYPILGNEWLDAGIKLGGFPLPNFMANYFIDQLENSPAGVLRYLSAKERERVGQGDLRGLWQPLTSLAVFGLAAAMRSNYYDRAGAGADQDENSVLKGMKTVGQAGAAVLPESGPEYYSIRVGGRNIDMRSTQFGATFFLADLVERNRRGIVDMDTYVKAGDLAKNLVGLDMRPVGTAADIITEALQSLQDADAQEKAGVLAGKYLGGQFASWLTPLTQISDFAAEFNAEEAKKRETMADDFRDTVAAQVQNRIPFAKQKLPEYQSATRREAPSKSTPLATQLSGIPTTEEPTFIERELSLLALKPKLPTSGVPSIDSRAREIMGDLMQKHSDRIERREGYLARAPQKRAVILEKLMQKFSIVAFKRALSEHPDKYKSRRIKEMLNKRLRIAVNRDRAARGQSPIEDIFDSKWMLDPDTDDQ